MVFWHLPPSLQGPDRGATGGPLHPALTARLARQAGPSTEFAWSPSMESRVLGIGEIAWHGVPWSPRNYGSRMES